ncbi:MAG: ammonium transporter [Lachnospiraceae bacterium]|jgi:Amt family ammonium transporter|nr:ammonium transporter [Lachnospiraceae bacterium]
MSWLVWFLIGAALVFFMQGGFAMVEGGLTRAKNAGNIIMKNLMDFCIGTVVFLLLGFSLMMGEHNGFIGKPSLDVFTQFTDSGVMSNFVFNLVFCATAATIVSGAMAERTKFSAYCIYSGVISLLIYPIEAGWVWNSDGWLASKSYIDFAGSSAIHMVGGVTAFIGAMLLGPRLGKYAVDAETGKKVPKAITGHSIPLAALGCFILWFGWYGFNGAAAGNESSLALIFANTTIAPGVATCVTMIFTWIKNGKPDVSMSLNGALAGLVAITAPCANVDPFGALIIGIVAGILVVVAVEFIDQVLKVDDPVGAVAVHGVNGIWGTLAVGLFANPNVVDAFGDGVATTGVAGLFYGGGFGQLGIQILGVVAILVWVIVTMTIVFTVIKKTNGLRVTAEEEIIGLDIPEHGLPSAYGGFMFAPEAVDYTVSELAEYGGAAAGGAIPKDAAVTVDNKAHKDAKITKVTIITNPQKYSHLATALDGIGITGITVTNVHGYGMQKGNATYYRGVKVETKLLPKVQIDIVICKVPTETLVKTVQDALYTGKIGDGKIFISDVENVIKVRTGETGYDALQDEE